MFWNSYIPLELPQKESMTEEEFFSVRLGWLIVPEKEIAYIYRADATVSKPEGFNNILSGEDVLPGFSFDLSILKS